MFLCKPTFYFFVWYVLVVGPQRRPRTCRGEWPGAAAPPQHCTFPAAAGATTLRTAANSGHSGPACSAKLRCQSTKPNQTFPCSCRADNLGNSTKLNLPLHLTLGPCHPTKPSPATFLCIELQKTKPNHSLQLQLQCSCRGNEPWPLQQTLATPTNSGHFKPNLSLQHQTPLPFHQTKPNLSLQL